MKIGTAILLCALTVMGAGTVRTQSVMITEFEAVGGDDWIELFNEGTNTVNLYGLCLTDDPENLTKWTFPPVSLGGQEFLQVWASGDDKRTPGQPLHTNFRLSAGGEYLALVHRDGKTILTKFAPEYPVQSYGVSYGFPMNGLEVLTNVPTFLQPTPGSPNPGTNVYGETPRLVPTELMYHPAATLHDGSYGADDFEFIELKNVGFNSIDLANMSLGGDVFFYSFGNKEQVLAAGDRILLVANREAFILRYGSGLPIAGEFSGRLDNEGGELTLSARGQRVFQFTYHDSWHQLTDGPGFSLVPVNETASPASYGQPGTWRASSRVGGSPGQVDPPPAAIPQIVVNEVLSGAELPFEDAIELFNPTDDDADISGWWLTDKRDTPKKFQIPAATIIPAHEFLALDERTLTFSFAKEGEEVYLFSADTAGNLTGYMHGFKFGGAEANVTFGRHVTSTGEEHFVAQSAMTLFASNAGPKIGPIVISEIHYQPVIPSVRFVELHNITSDPVALFDMAYPTNTWRLRGVHYGPDVGFTFPTNTVIAAGGNMVLDWRDTFYTGVELVRVEQFSSNRIAEILVDRVRYASASPWPSGANGKGASLQRIDNHAYGDDPANWRAALPSPGIAVQAGSAGTPPFASLESHDSFVTEGGSVTLSASAIGSTPLNYQWLYDGRAIPGAVNSTLSWTNLHPEQTGHYSCYVFNPHGSVLTGITLLTVIPASLTNGRPSVSVTTPVSSFVKVRTNRLTLAGAAHDDVVVTRVLIQQSGRPIQTAIGTDRWSATFDLLPGSNGFKITAENWAGHYSVTSSINVLSDYNSLGLVIHGEGVVVGRTNGQLLADGRHYGLKATPRPMNVFSNWVDAFGNVVSIDPLLRFVALSNVTLTANFVPNPFASLRGTYAGLFYEPSELAHDSSGSFTLTLGRRGHYTGWLRHGGKRYSLRGHFSLALSSHRTLAIAGRNPLALDLQLALGLDDVTGSVTSENFVSELSGARILVGRTNAGIDAAGAYAVTFVESDDRGVAVTTAGTGRLVIHAGGRTSLAARLSDGANIAMNIPITGEGWLPVYIPLYRGRGSIFGWLAVTNLVSDTFLGSLLWTKVNVASSASFKPGFTNRVEAHGVRLLWAP